MATYNLTYPKFQAFDANGLPLSGGKVFTYEAGTSTPLTTWVDSDKITPNANPVILDSNGEADIFFEQTMKVVLKDSTDVTLWTFDDIKTSNDAEFVNYDNSSSGLVATNVKAALDELDSDIATNEANIASNDADITALYKRGDLKNYIINGDFRIWQRALSQTTNGYGSCDRMYLAAGGTTTFATTRSAWLPGTTFEGTSPDFYLGTSLTPVSGVNDYFLVNHRIPNLIRFSSKQLTFSVWANSAPDSEMAVEFGLQFGTGGSPSSPVTGMAVQKFNLTAAHTKHTMTFTVPDLDPYTLGTNGDHYLNLSIWFHAGSNFNARTDSLGYQPGGPKNLWLMQLEDGPDATQFDLWEDMVATELCEQFYWKSYPIGTFPGSVTVNGSQTCLSNASTSTYGIDRKIGHHMRASPTVTWYSPSTGAINTIRNASGGADLAVSSSAYMTEESTGIPILSSSPAAGLLLLGHCTLDSEL